MSVARAATTTSGDRLDDFFITSATHVTCDLIMKMQAHNFIYFITYSKMEIANGASFVLTRKSVAGALPFPLVVAVSSQPTIRGQISFSLPHEYNISSLSATEFTILWSVVKEFVVDINNASQTAVRYATATDGKASIQLFPLRLRSQEWQPIIHPGEFFSERYPGYLTTQRASSRTRNASQYASSHYSSLGMVVAVLCLPRSY
jgi:hypothetical protein